MSVASAPTVASTAEDHEEVEVEDTEEKDAREVWEEWMREHELRAQSKPWSDLR